MNRYVIIMAGGGGTRFWPLSRQNAPKQLLNLSGNDIMINETIKRMEGVVDYNNMFIVTSSSQAKALEMLVVEEFNSKNILVEPFQKNTAPCILYSAMLIEKQFGEGIMCVLPSDHHIKDIERYKNTVAKGFNLAESNDVLVTIGIQPTFAATGYGYIQCDINHSFEKAFSVSEFIEKPNYETALRFYESGNYLWNSGMFIWKTSIIIDNFKRFLPKIYERMKTIFSKDEIEKEELAKIYQQFPNISIDYGIMERSNDVFVIPGDFGWNDVGSWDSLGAIFQPDHDGNIVKADHISIDTKNAIIYGNNKLVATVGIENMIIVNTDDALLVCPKNRAQDVKKIVDSLIEHKRYDLL